MEHKMNKPKEISCLSFQKDQNFYFPLFIDSSSPGHPLKASRLFHNLVPGSELVSLPGFSTAYTCIQERVKFQNTNMQMTK